MRNDKGVAGSIAVETAALAILMFLFFGIFLIKYSSSFCIDQSRNP